MISQYTKAVGQLQELFQELAEEGKISVDQAGRFDNSQKVLVNFHSWIRNQFEGNTKVELPWTDQVFVDAWNLWKNYKKEQFSFSYKPIGEQSALLNLSELSGGNMEMALAILKQSRDNGWKGLFELKTQNTITKNKVDAQNLDYKQSLFNRLTQQE